MIGRRRGVGWEITCDATGCTATTAAAAPSPLYRRTPEGALDAADLIGWTAVTIDGTLYRVCPMHQTWDPRLERWVATPLAVRPLAARP